MRTRRVDGIWPGLAIPHPWIPRFGQDDELRGFPLYRRAIGFKLPASTLTPTLNR